MQAVLDVVTVKPHGGPGAREVEHLGRLAAGQARVFDLLADLRCGTGLWMNTCAYVVKRSDEVLRWSNDRRKAGDELVKHGLGAEESIL